MSKPDAAVVNEWVSALQNAYPSLPHPLDIETEERLWEELTGWRGRVEELRSRYDDSEELPEWTREWKGGKQVIPCLLSVESMTEEELDAAHKLFVCLSPKMADSALGYWRAHDRDSEASMELRDLLGQLFQVFLVVLSSYDPFREHSPDHDGDFASGNRVRLVTWVHMASRYHINSYLQSAAYSVRPGSGHRHRLFQKVRSAERKFMAQNGRLPTSEETAEAIGGESSPEPEPEGRLPRPSSDAGGGKSLTERVDEARRYRDPVSLQEPAGGPGESFEDGALTWGDTMDSSNPGSYAEIESFFDPSRVIESRVAGDEVLTGAAKKLLVTGEHLSPKEKYALGL